MNQKKRHLLRGAAVAAALVALSPAAWAINEPYAIAATYDSSVHNAVVSWKADDPAVYNFAIERRPVGRTEWTQVATADASARSFNDSTVAPLTRYEYRVRAFRPGGPRTGYLSTTSASYVLNFPYNRPYAYGIRPSNYSQAQMNADVRDMYNLWRAKYVTTAGAGAGARVYKPDEGGVTVSEGQGYGMLISVYMADDTNNGKSDFDKMLTYYKSKLKTNADGSSRGLMNWKINPDGTVADPYVAPDGDLDAAFALLAADRKWGSGNGNPNYLAEAQSIMNALQKYAVYNRSTGASKLIANSDKELNAQEGSSNFTMSSYQMVSYFKQFADASDATRATQWRDTLKAGYKMVDYFRKLNPNTSLLPYAFLTQPGTLQFTKHPSKGYTFGADSCRTPWRVGLDFLWHGNANSTWANSQDPAIGATLAQDMPRTNASWFMTAVNGNPSAAWYSYNLNGTQSATFRWGQRHTGGSMAVGAMTDASNQANLNKLYDFMRVQIPGVDYNGGGYRVPMEYFGDTVMMVTMLVVTGNMPNLPEVPVPLK